MAIPIYVDKLGIEITRKCPSKCNHCMRGDAQNINISPKIIDNIFENNDHKIKYINELILTGGEIFSNKEGLVYFLEYLLKHNIPIEFLGAVTNSLIYDNDIIDLLKHLSKKTKIQLETRKDQFHPIIPVENLTKLKSLKFYKYNELELTTNRIIRIGRALKNNLGDESLTNRKLEIFKYEISKYLLVTRIDIKQFETFDIRSLYVTAKGNFGSEMIDATWDMIDEKYTLDIIHDSLFTNCAFTLTAKNRINYLKNNHKILTIPSFMRDYKKAKEEGILDIFFASLNEDKIREYLVNQNGISKQLKIS